MYHLAIMIVVIANQVYYASGAGLHPDAQSHIAANLCTPWLIDGRTPTPVYKDYDHDACDKAHDGFILSLVSLPVMLLALTIVKAAISFCFGTPAWLLVKWF